jgi:GT2 family glycosyltransferase
MKLSIIILTWNSKRLLKRCLSSIQVDTTTNNYEIIIIDNNSTDATRALLESISSEGAYHIIFNNQNKGVGHARNQGIKLATGKYILILDVDTIIAPGAIDKLVDYLEQSPKCGLVAPKLTDVDGNLQLTCRKYPTIVSKSLRRIPFNWAQELLSEEEMHDWDHACIREVDYVIGACQLIRKSVIQEIGLLDENIFYGPEDIDFCLRIWQAGYKVVYNPEAIIIHDEQRITKRRYFSKMTWEHIKGLAYFFWKHKYLFSRSSLYESISNRLG